MKNDALVDGLLENLSDHDTWSFTFVYYISGMFSYFLAHNIIQPNVLGLQNFDPAVFKNKMRNLTNFKIIINNNNISYVLCVLLRLNLIDTLK